MGIRGLTVALRPYGNTASLQDETVVIDGPALVHRIHEGCACRWTPQGCSFLTRPSYALVGQMLIAWLDALRHAKVNVRKIYFDGYLPPSKWGVRRERLRKQLAGNHQLVIANPVGVSRPPEDAFSECEPGIFLTKGRQDSAQSRPPFLVPAALETLKSHEHWGPLVKIVPGEADVYCAQDIRENGGTVLTSDSDLLIQNFGPGGAVSFFWDIDGMETPSAGGTPPLQTVKFSFGEINRRLGLDEASGDVSLVAFLKDSGQMSNITKACQAIKDDKTGALASTEYMDFLKEHEMVDFIPADHPVLRLCSDLDPRVSELVVQTFVERPADADTCSTTSAQRGPERLSMFLPVMMEDQRQKSCWTVSTSTRQIAYGLLQLCSENFEGSIVEYRTLNLNSPHMGRKINIPGSEETLEECAHLQKLISGIKDHYSEPSLQWFATAVLYDASWSLTEQRESSLSAVVMGELTQTAGETADYSWNFINWCAQVQASYYSLRMLRQVVDVAIHLRRSSSSPPSPPLPEPVYQLMECLRDLPRISDWPDEKGIANFTKQTGFQGLWKIATVLLGASEADSNKIFSAPEQPSLLRKKKKKNRSRITPRPDAGKGKTAARTNINPFALLSTGIQ